MDIPANIPVKPAIKERRFAEMVFLNIPVDFRIDLPKSNASNCIPPSGHRLRHQILGNKNVQYYDSGKQISFLNKLQNEIRHEFPQKPYEKY